MDRFVVKLKRKVKDDNSNKDEPAGNAASTSKSRPTASTLTCIEHDDGATSASKNPRLENPHTEPSLNCVSLGLSKETSTITDVSCDSSSGPMQPRTDFPRRFISGN